MASVTSWLAVGISLSLLSYPGILNELPCSPRVLTGIQTLVFTITLQILNH